jgi:ribonuclease HI
MHKEKAPKSKNIVAPQINKEVPWRFFDGSSQGHPGRCGARAVLYISTSHYYNILYMPRRGSNEKMELAALWELLFMVSSLNLRKVHIFGDSKIVVD